MCVCVALSYTVSLLFCVFVLKPFLCSLNNNNNNNNKLKGGCELFLF